MNVIFIRPKMDYWVSNKVVGAAAKLKEQVRQQSRAQRRTKRGRGHSEQNDVEFEVGAYQTALLIHNVLGWHGPAFVGVACTPENIASLDPDEPLVQTVVDEITTRNAPKDDEPAPELDDPNVIDLTAATTAT